MSFNVLEELVREYYEYKGCFVKTNIRFDKLQAGGYMPRRFPRCGGYTRMQ